MPSVENNKNIQTFLRFTVPQSIGTGVWMGSVFSLFIVIMAEESGSLFGLLPNELLGATSAVSGMVTLLLVVPAGMLADRWSREGTIRVATGSGMVGVLFLMLGNSIYSVILGLVFYGGFHALSGPVPLFALRNALMNASQPLSRSIMMDHVPKKNRGVWNSLQSVAWGLFWSASAVLGGFLIGDGNFRRCFLITAVVYAVGTLPPPLHRSIRGERIRGWPHGPAITHRAPSNPTLCFTPKKGKLRDS